MSDPPELYLLGIARSPDEALLLAIGAWLVLAICVTVLAALR